MDGPLPRVGTFFIIVGLGLLALFVASIQARMVSPALLGVGAGLIAIGMLFRRRAAPLPPSERFGTMRRMRERRSKKAEEKKQKREQKK